MFIFPGPASAGGDTRDFQRPHPADFVAKVPGDIATFGRTTFTRRNAPAIGLIVLTSGLLILTDRYTQARVWEGGNRLGISHTQYQKTFLTVPVPGSRSGFALKGPFDSGSGLYFLGDGMVDLGLAGGFLAYGAAASDNRALATSSAIVESIIGVGLVEQVVKRTTGRPSPFTTDHDANLWRTFPNQKNFNAHVASFDAFPSGHLGAAVATVTVIATNYPEHAFVRPVGIALLTVLGLQMMNNGVHWAGDYPLAIGIGYSFGRIAAARGRPADRDQAWRVTPVIVDRGLGLAADVRFGGRPRRNG